MPALVQLPGSLVKYNVVEISIVLLTFFSSPSPLSPLIYTACYLYVSGRTLSPTSSSRGAVIGVCVFDYNLFYDRRCPYFVCDSPNVLNVVVRLLPDRDGHGQSKQNLNPRQHVSEDACLP
jgi:hypothetical protein